MNRLVFTLAIVLASIAAPAQAACSLDCRYLFFFKCSSYNHDCPANCIEDCSDGTCGLFGDRAFGFCAGVPGSGYGCLAPTTIVDCTEEWENHPAGPSWALVDLEASDGPAVRQASSEQFATHAIKQVEFPVKPPFAKAIVLSPSPSKGGLRHEWDDARLYDGPEGYVVLHFDVEIDGRAISGATIQGGTYEAAEAKDFAEWLIGGMIFHAYDSAKGPWRVFAIGHVGPDGSVTLTTNY